MGGASNEAGVKAHDSPTNDLVHATVTEEHDKQITVQGYENDIHNQGCWHIQELH